MVEVGDPSWLLAWAAVADFLRLLADRPERIRGCGNRVKAQRHYARHRQG